MVRRRAGLRGVRPDRRAVRGGGGSCGTCLDRKGLHHDVILSAAKNLAVMPFPVRRPNLRPLGKSDDYSVPPSRPASSPSSS